MTLEKAQALIATARETKAKFLDLGDVGLRSIPDEVFELSHLRGLNLGRRYFKDGVSVKSQNGGERNIIRFIPFKIRHLFKLRELSLNGCYAIDIFNLKETPFLEVLDLTSNNALRDHGSLTRLKRLRILSLQSSNFGRVELLKDLKRLEYINLNFCGVSSLHYFEKHSKLRHLQLDYVLPHSHTLRYVPQLKHLSLNNIFYKDLRDIAKLHDLESLYLGDCGIKNADQLGSLKKLKLLDLWHNELTDCNFIADMEQLETLNLSVNQIKKLPNLPKLQALKSLDLSQNHLENYQDIEQLKQLDTVDLSYANREQLAVLTKLKTLSSIKLRDMKLTTEELGVFSSRKPLRNFDVRWNLLESIPEWLNNWQLALKNGVGDGLHLYGNLIDTV